MPLKKMQRCPNKAQSMVKSLLPIPEYILILILSCLIAVNSTFFFQKFTKICNFTLKNAIFHHDFFFYQRCPPQAHSMVKLLLPIPEYILKLILGCLIAVNPVFLYKKL
jgi:uncharacterized protein YjeT (DUF2065 family)